MNKFSNKSIEELGFYVYSLVDPRDGKIFYIGKGCGNRVFQHCEAALQGDEVSLKIKFNSRDYFFGITSRALYTSS